MGPPATGEKGYAPAATCKKGKNREDKDSDEID